MIIQVDYIIFFSIALKNHQTVQTNAAFWRYLLTCHAKLSWMHIEFSSRGHWSTMFRNTDIHWKDSFQIVEGQITNFVVCWEE